MHINLVFSCRVTFCDVHELTLIEHSVIIIVSTDVKYCCL